MRKTKLGKYAAEMLNNSVRGSRKGCSVRTSKHSFNSGTDTDCNFNIVRCRRNGPVRAVSDLKLYIDITLHYKTNINDLKYQ